MHAGLQDDAMQAVCSSGQAGHEKDS
jgi:hypothetical protein